MNRNKTTSIVVPKFQWCPALSFKNKAEIMMDCILTHYEHVLKRDSLYLKEITFCLNEEIEYFAFVNVLREISDDLIKKGKIRW